MLANELQALRSHLRTLATPEADLELGVLAKAEEAAKEGNGPKVLKILKGAGAWLAEGARDLGVAIAAEAISKAQGH